MQTYFIKGRDKATGETVYWTGRAGTFYADKDQALAFVCTREYAKRRMAQLNNNLAPVRWTEIVER